MRGAVNYTSEKEGSQGKEQKVMDGGGRVVVSEAAPLTFG